MRKEIYENQESSDTLPFHWEFGKEEITLKVSSYAYGNGLAVLMYSQSEGELELFRVLKDQMPPGCRWQILNGLVLAAPFPACSLE